MVSFAMLVSAMAIFKDFATIYKKSVKKLFKGGDFSKSEAKKSFSTFND
jgi:hypothetical protein